MPEARGESNMSVQGPASHAHARLFGKTGNPSLLSIQLERLGTQMSYAVKQTSPSYVRMHHHSGMVSHV